MMTEAPFSSAPPASIRRRLLAHVLDSIVVAVLGLVVAALVSALLPALSVAEGSDGTLRLVVDPVRLVAQSLTVAVLSGAYFTWSWSSRPAATPAQRALGVRVIAATDGTRLTAGRAALRWAATGVPLGIVAAALVEAPAAWLAVVALAGAWTIALLISARRHPHRRGLHDRIAGSVVVRSGD
jgi:uncharacterized RDD family membrane protein YckC